MEDHTATIVRDGKFWMARIWDEELDSYRILGAGESVEEAIFLAAERGYNTEVVDT